MTDELVIKSDFEIFKVNSDIAYFDSASTTLVPKIAVDATTNFLDTVVASARRGAYKLAIKGGSIVKDVREDLATFLKGDSSSFSSDIYITPKATSRASPFSTWSTDSSILRTFSILALGKPTFD